jgi:FkbM family methyltransferase
VNFLGKPIHFNAPFWFLHSVDELFVEEVYRFNAQTETPYIIDCGANIGLSVLYFKELYPKAEVLAFEADPFIHSILQKNIGAHQHQNVELVNAAVWNEKTTLRFQSEGSVGGKINLEGKGTGNEVEVPTIRLKDYLNRPVDFLKIDIEGVEYQVLKDCKDSLQQVKNLFIEYHIMPGERQHLHEVLAWVHEAGFTYYIREAWHNMTYPFTGGINEFFQMQLNIFCYRQS